MILLLSTLPVLAPRNLVRHAFPDRGTPSFWPLAMFCIRVRYQCSSHWVQWPKLKPQAFSFSQWVGVGHQELLAVWVPLPKKRMLLPSYIIPQWHTCKTSIDTTDNPNFVFGEIVIPVFQSLMGDMHSQTMYHHGWRWAKQRRINCNVFPSYPSNNSTS